MREESWMQSLLSGQFVHDEDDDIEITPRRRLLFILIFAVAGFLLLGARLTQIYYVSAGDLSQLAKENRIREVVQYAPRGKILDRNGNELAVNSLIFQLSATPLLMEDEQNLLDEDLNLLKAVLGVKPKQVKEKLDRSSEAPNLPILIADNLSHKQALEIESRITKLKGFSLDEIPIRSYNSEAGLAHIVGYTGRVSEYDLDDDETGKLLPTDFIGKSGVEYSYDEHLRGENGWQRIEVDALGSPVRVLGRQDPKPGKDLTLSIDLDTQKAMADAMKSQMAKAKVERGAGVAVSPKNGEVLALVSIPYFDNNHFAKGITEKKFKQLSENQNEPLLNKVSSGGFTTGSIIKPLVASAALQEGVVDENTIINDNGYIDVVSQYDPSQFFRFEGWRITGLGPMNVRRAIAWSSNIYFYTVGGGHGGIDGLGEERLTSAYRHFGLGEKTGLDIPGETDGRVPDEQWKLENKGEPWYVGDSYNIAIGQGDMVVSPLQITMAHASIANDGFLLEPQLIKGAERKIKRELRWDKSILQIVREGMRQVLLDGTTCECTFSKVPVKVAGKSGTAETNTPGGRRPHAWFTTFAPYENPEVTVTVLLEEGVGGSLHSAPVIAKTLEEYFKN